LVNIDGYELIDLIKSSIEVLMNMKNFEQDEIGGGGDVSNQNNYYKREKSNFDDINDSNIEIELPEGAKAGLKDISEENFDT
jgi:hypothetical protein